METIQQKVEAVKEEIKSFRVENEDDLEQFRLKFISR
jgi:hypothetical protein